MSGAGELQEEVEYSMGVKVWGFGTWLPGCESWLSHSLPVTGEFYNLSVPQFPYLLIGDHNLSVCFVKLL